MAGKTVFPYWGLRRRDQSVVTGTSQELADKVVAAGMFASDTPGRVKLGDGVTRYADLPWFGEQSVDVLGSTATLPRIVSGIAADIEIEGSGNAHLTFFTADQDLTVTRLRLNVGNQAATGVTVAKLALYRVDAAGNIDLAGVTAHTPDLASAMWSEASAPLVAPVSVRRGERLVFGALFVGATMPRFFGLYVNWGDSNEMLPRLAGSLNGITDFPSHVNAGSLSGSGRVLYGRLLTA